MLMNIYIIPFIICINSVTSKHIPGCPTNITVVWWRHPVFASLENEHEFFPTLIRKTTEKCCNQANLTLIERWEHEMDHNDEMDYDDQEDIDQEMDYDLEFPVSMKLEDFSVRSTNYMKSFIPVITSPGAVYLVRGQSTSSSQIILILQQLWPLLVIIIISTCFAGIIIWALDCRSNTVHFPKSFIPGFIEGMWWAFVSMTTVGYGDRTPRSLPAKAFGVIWILAGICVISVLTSIITTSLTTATQARTTDIYDKKVVVLFGSEEHLIAISEGAIVTECPNITCLNETIFNGQVDGALLDELVARTVDSFLEDRLRIGWRSKTPIIHGIHMGLKAPNEVKECYVRKIASMRKRIYKREHSHQTSYKAKWKKEKENAKDKNAGDYAAAFIRGDSSLFTIAVTVSTGILLFLVVTLGIVDQMFWKHHKHSSISSQHKTLNERAGRPKCDSAELQVSSSFGFNSRNRKVDASTNT